MPAMAVDPRGHAAFVTAVAFNAVAACFVGGRCIARFYMVRTCGADDVLILFAVVASVTFTALIQDQNRHGLGRHIEKVNELEQVEFFKPFWVSIMIYYLGLTLIKSSILCQFQRFFVSPTIRRVCWFLLALIAVYGVCTILGAAFSCTPVSYFWNRKNGHCINLLAFWFTNATFNIVSDICIVILPMPVLKGLHLPKKQKFSLIFVFAVGGFGCITSIIRLHSLYTVAHSTDYTSDNVGAATWSAIELSVGIICACLPTLKPVVNHFFPKLLLSKKRNNMPTAGIGGIKIGGNNNNNNNNNDNTRAITFHGGPQHSGIIRDTRITQHSVPRSSADVEAGLSYGFPMPHLKWKDEDKVYMKSAEHEEYASSSESAEGRKSSLVLNTYSVIPEP